MDNNAIAVAAPSRTICQICHRQFSQPQSLRRHVTEVHDRTRRHICRFCQRSFRRPYALRLHERIHIPQDHHVTPYQHDGAYQRVKNLFQNEISTYFPDTPCAHCGTLLLPRNVSWVAMEDNQVYPIEEISQQQPRIRTTAAHSEIAICSKCRVIPQKPITGGPWPTTLLELPQHSRMFLSPLTINTNLGRTQGAQATLHPYTTYRTVTGKHRPIFRNYPSKISNVDRNLRLIMWKIR